MGHALADVIKVINNAVGGDGFLATESRIWPTQNGEFLQDPPPRGPFIQALKPWEAATFEVKRATNGQSGRRLLGRDA